MTSTDISLTRVTALLAQGPGQPEGDITQGLELLLGLTADGRIDPETYLTDPQPWTARRFRPERPDWHGELIRDEGAWTLRGVLAEDGPQWIIEARRMHPGNYVTLRRPDGEEFVFRIVGVTQD